MKEQDQKVAYDMGDAWLLQYRDKDGNFYPEEGIDCPDGWPDAVDEDFLRSKGYQIIP